MEMIRGLQRVGQDFILSNRKFLTTSPFRHTQSIPADHIIPRNDSAINLKINKSVIN